MQRESLGFTTHFYLFSISDSIELPSQKLWHVIQFRSSILIDCINRFCHEILTGTRNVRQFHSRISLVFLFLFSVFIFFYFHGHFQFFRFSFFFLLLFWQFNSRFYAFLMCKCSHWCLSNPFRPPRPCNSTPQCMLRFYWFLQLLVYGPTASRGGGQLTPHFNPLRT